MPKCWEGIDFETRSSFVLRCSTSTRQPSGTFWREPQRKRDHENNYKRQTNVFEELVAEGGIGLRTLGLRGATPLEGGLPIIMDGTIVGAIGVSGGSSVQDGQVAKA